MEGFNLLTDLSPIVAEINSKKQNLSDIIDKLEAELRKLATAASPASSGTDNEISIGDKVESNSFKILPLVFLLF